MWKFILESKILPGGQANVIREQRFFFSFRLKIDNIKKKKEKPPIADFTNI